MTDRPEPHDIPTEQFMMIAGLWYCHLYFSSNCQVPPYSGPITGQGATEQEAIAKAEAIWRTHIANNGYNFICERKVFRHG